MTKHELYKELERHACEFIGEDIAIDDASQSVLQLSSLDLLRDNGIPLSLLDGKLVFLMHQGYVFSCVRLNSLAGPVYTYSEETKKMVSDFKTINELISAYGE